MALPKLLPRKLGFVARNKNRFRAQVTLNRARAADAEDDLALLRACETRGGIPGLLARLPAGVASIKLPPVASGSGPSRMSLLLRGLNIQYPFSRLILAGLKDTEVRDYALGYRNIAHPGEEMFLIETPPKNLASVAVDCTHLGPPPRRAQVVGTVSFSESEKYMTRAAWNRDRKRHCIKRGSLLDWPCGKGQKYAWRIGQVRRFHEPVPVSDHTQTGYPTRRQLTVSFAGLEAWDVRSRVGASEVVGNGGHGMHIQQPGAAMYIYISICISICV